MSNDDAIQRLLSVLPTFRLTLPDYVVLHLVFYEPRHYSDAVDWALGLIRDTGIPSPSRAECITAQNCLISSGFLQIIDRDGLERIRRYLADAPAIGPVGPARS